MSTLRQTVEELSELAQTAATQTAAQLRAEFDRTFALPPPQPAGKARDFVILQVAGQRYALAAQGLRSIERTGSRSSNGDHAGGDPSDSKDAVQADSFTSLDGGRSTATEWVRIPSTQAALLGIRSFSGRIVPVFALATLLGLDDSSTEPSHCVLVPVGPDLVGFAFDALLRFVRIEPEQIFAPGAAAQTWEQATLSDSGEVLAVIAMPALLRLLAASSSQTPLHETPSVQIGKS